MARLRTGCFDAAAFARPNVASEGWRNAVDSHHLPEGTHSLAPRPGSLGRLTFHEIRPRPPPRSRNRNQGFEDEDENDDEKDLKLVRVAGLAPATFPF